MNTVAIHITTKSDNKLTNVNVGKLPVQNKISVGVQLIVSVAGVEL